MATARLVPLIHYLRRVATPELGATDGRLLAAFAAHRDEHAFAQLVRRHGPMVLGICSRVLRDWHAAEDAFQATFLVLARKAGSIAHPERLAAWLHGVAHRTAVRARAESLRRQTREKQAPVPSTVAPADGPDWDDLRPVLDEEINRLPDRYRVPFVLCYLQDHTNAEAARRLGCSRGTIATLLARARQRLRGRLMRRGLTLSGLAGSALTPRAEAVPAALESATAQAAALFATGTTSAPAAPLAIGVIRAMLMTRIKVAATLLLAVAVVGAGVGVSAYRARAQEVIVPQARAKPASQPLLSSTLPPPTVESPPEEKIPRYVTPNFVVTAPTQKIAREVARHAEHDRRQKAIEWLGKDLPEWPRPCRLQVKITAGACAGATSFAFDKGKVLSQDMHLEGSLQTILNDCLPHEVTHTILAHWYGKPLPRWADEGIALLSESDASQVRHGAMMMRVLDEGRRIPLRHLLSSHEYPRDVMALYAEAYSLTAFLVKNGDRNKLLRFVRQGDPNGWDEAVRAHYPWKNVDQLEKAWLASIDKAAHRQGEKRGLQSTTRTAPELKQKPRGGLPAGPAPVQLLVELEGDQLCVWRTSIVYVAKSSFTDQGEPVTSYQPITVVRPLMIKLAEVRAYDVKGKAIDRKKLPALLKEQTLVLAAADGRPVDPWHLRLYKDNTLVLLFPEPTPPAPPIAPLSAPPADSSLPAIPPLGGERKD